MSRERTTQMLMQVHPALGMLENVDVAGLFSENLDSFVARWEHAMGSTLSVAEHLAQPAPPRM